MLERIAEWVGQKFKALRKYYNGLEVLELLGLLLGIGVLITIFVLGIAAIVASGGAASAVILAACGLIVGVVAINNYTNFARAIGIIINLMIDHGQPTYEKMGTALGFGVGVVVAIALVAIGWPVAVPLLAAATTVLPWMIALIAVPLTIASFQGGGRVLGRLLDRYGPSLKPEINFKSEGETTSTLVMEKVLAKAQNGIQLYLASSREHLDFWSYYFDKETGINRASTYMSLLENCPSELQKAIILYTMLASNQGNMLQDTVVKSMQIRNKKKAVATLGKYINDHAKEEDIPFIKESLIEKLHLFANSGEKPENPNIKYRELANNFKDIQPRVTL